MFKKPLTLGDIPLKKDWSSDIRAKQAQLSHIEQEALNLKNEIEFLFQKQRENITLKWRPEIRSCVKNDATGECFIARHHDIVACIEYKYCIKADRDIKNKIVTNLSVMHSNGELGRLEHNGEYYYGLAEIFNSDLTTLKRQYMKMLPK